MENASPKKSPTSLFEFGQAVLSFNTNRITPSSFFFIHNKHFFYLNMCACVSSEQYARELEKLLKQVTCDACNSNLKVF